MSPTDDLPRWESPYSVRSVGYWFFKDYQLWFEGAPLFTYSDRDTAEHVAAACNGAWNLGRTEQFMRGQN